MKKSILLLSFITLISSALSQNDKKIDDIWNQYSSDGNAQKIGQNHDIFDDINNNQEYESNQTISINLSFKFKYDTLYKRNTDSFKWIVKSLPEGADFDTKNKRLTWKPGLKELGEHRITFLVRHENIIDSLTINFTVVEQWESSWLPGISYSYYRPNDKVGSLSGPSVEYLFFSWIHRNENRGPSHGRVYLKMDLLSGSDECFFYGIGVNLSIERNAQRNFLIPYYGFEFGGFYNKDIKNTIYLSPLAGFWLYSSQNFFVNLSAQYVFPTSAFEDFKGLKGNLGFNFSLW
jgi:hypothetical protein